MKNLLDFALHLQWPSAQLPDKSEGGVQQYRLCFGTKHFHRLQKCNTQALKTSECHCYG